MLLRVFIFEEYRSSLCKLISCFVSKVNYILWRIAKCLDKNYISLQGLIYLQSNSLDELGVGDDDDGDRDGEAEGVDEDDVPHVGVQGGLGPDNTTAGLIKY